MKIFLMMRPMKEMKTMMISDGQCSDDNLNDESKLCNIVIITIINVSF